MSHDLIPVEKPREVEGEWISAEYAKMQDDYKYWRRQAAANGAHRAYQESIYRERLNQIGGQINGFDYFSGLFGSGQGIFGCGGWLGL